MTQKITLLFFLLFSATFLTAQKQSNLNKVSITGQVIDSKTKQPLEYATVVLKNTKTQKITGGITNEKGNFNIQTSKGNYEINIEFISFKITKFPTQRISSNKNLGVIMLVEDTNSLNEIVVVQKNLQSIFD